jgi:hypothetical protein
MSDRSLSVSNLLRRTLHVGVGTEDAAVTRLRLKHRLASWTDKEMLAGIQRHLESFFMAAVRARQRRVQFYF